MSALAEVVAAHARELGTDDVVLRDEPMARHTSMRVGGPADLFCEVQSERSLAALLRSAHERSMPVFLLGGGTNLVVADAGIRGLTIKLGRGFAGVTWEEEDASGARLAVGAAANFKRLVLETIDRGLAGLEFGEGIPGTVGGGVLMNAGAFGGEIADVVLAVHGLRADGTPARLERDELSFAYRRLDLPAGFVVTRLEIRLRRDDPAAIAARVAEAKRKRGRRQPLGLPNAGSIFKNPPGAFVGRLIEECGLKGRRIGDAQISEQHANFIVNLGGARAADVRALMDLMRDTVLERHGILLEPEVRLVGEW